LARCPVRGVGFALGSRAYTFCVPAAVDVSDLRKSFGTVVALDGVTWQAATGEITAVLGPNGAGKTTMVECCEGLRRPDAGAVRVLGADPWRSSAEHRARVGVMLQDGGLPNAARPVALLEHLARLYAAPRPVRELVTALGIDDFAGTTVRRLSGGQRQRVALAAALVGRPEVAFLDEPTAGLDPHARLDVWDLIRSVADAGSAVVMTTHSFDEAERLADRIVIIAHGRVVAQGTLAELTGTRSLEQLYFDLTRQATS
jgi:ABC-2 type transport system ATP-binding protein